MTTDGFQPDECPDPERDCPAQEMFRQFGVWSQSLSIHANSMELMIGRIDDVVGKVDRTLFGNGSPGIVLRIDRIEQSELRREKTQETLRKIAVGMIIGLGVQTATVVCAAIYAMIVFYHSSGAPTP